MRRYKLTDNIVAMIKEQLPGFNFQQSRNEGEWKQIIDICFKKREKAYEAKALVGRMAEIENKTIVPGVIVRLERMGKITETSVITIGKDNRLKLKGIKGSFSPFSVEVIKQFFTKKGENDEY